MRVARVGLPENLLGAMTGRRAVLLCAIFALAAMLGGCQALGVQSLGAMGQGVGAWAERQVTAGWQDTKAVVRGLRAAPRDETRFAYRVPRPAPHDTHDAALNTVALERAVWMAGMNRSDPVRREAIDRTLDNGVMVFRPGNGFRTVQTPRYGAAPLQQPVARPVLQTHAAAPAIVPASPISYVKIDGTLDMADWTDCEQRVGGAFLVSPTATRLAPDFDACMRARGYVSEAEAETVLAGGR